jgi:hypothetical protein
LSIPAAIVACGMLAALGLFQALLVAGAPLGHVAWGGQHRVLPRHLRAGSAVAIVIYALFAATIVQRAGLLALFPAAVADIGIWIVLGYLVLGIGANAVSRSRVERLTMVPVSAILAALVLVVAMGW